MRVLFFLRNFSGYFRQFEPAFDELLRRGHEVRVVRDRRDDMRGEEWAEELRSRHPAFSWSGPLDLDDRWYDLRRQLRLTADYVYFLRPEYARSGELVERARRRAPDAVLRLLSSPVGPALRRPAVVGVVSRALRAAEQATPSPRPIRDLIDRRDPDVVLLTPHLMPGSPQQEVLRAALDTGRVAVLCVASWDNLSSKQLIRVQPDLVTVWNETQRREAIEIHGLEEERIAVTGAQVYDPWFAWRPREASEFRARVGLPADRPYILYAAGALFPAALTEAEFVASRWLPALRSSPDPALRDAAVLIRPHPKRFAEWADVELKSFENVMLWPREGRMPVDDEARADFYDSIHHSAGVAGINTSAMIEAGIVGKRVHTVLVPEFAGSQHGTLHFRYLTEVGGGLLREAGDIDAHVVQLAESLHTGGEAPDGNRAFLEAFVRPNGRNRPAAAAFCDAIEAAAVLPSRGRPRSHAQRALRVALEPVRVGFWLWEVERQRRRHGRGIFRYPRLPSLAVREQLRRAKLRVRGGTDRERALYVGARKVLAPGRTITRARAARASSADGLAIPEDRGYLILPPGQFEEAGQIVAEADRLLAATDVEALERKGKKFMLPLVDQEALDRDSPLLRLALRQDLLAAVASYLRIAPLLTNVNLYLSRSTDRKLHSSQLFHCDGDDVRQVKVFVLCNEVTPDNGPLMVMDAATSERLRRKVGYLYRNRVTDKQARKAVGNPPLAALEGAPGRVCLVDTSRCFHYGSRVGREGEPRLAVMLQYLTPHSFMLPRRAETKAPFKRLASSEDPDLVRLALGG